MPTNRVILCLAFFLAAVVALAQSSSKPAQSETQSRAPAAGAAAPSASDKIPPEAVKQANPVKASAESIAAGKRMYGYDCAMCHGASGDGKGDLAGDMKVPLVDFRDAKAMQSRSDGELFYIIKTGKGEMPGEGSRAKPEQIWNMVNYVRSLAKKESAEKK
jgi:mono/diheme cytochrome c family protein